MRDKILIVDSVETERNTLVEILKDEATIITASDGEEGLALLEKHCEECMIVLLKFMVMKMDGIKVLEAMNEKGLIDKVPVLVVDRPGASAMEAKCFDLGAADFIQKPFGERFVKQRVKNISQNFLRKEEYNAKMDKHTKILKHKYQIFQKQTKELEDLRKKTVDMLGVITEFRNVENKEHVKHVKEITAILANEMMKSYPECGLDEKKIDAISAVSVLHDIGKLTISDSVLMKPEKLTEEEEELMKSHTTKGEEILDQISGIWEESYENVVREICRSHHERYDGKGYPDRLAGDAIPLSAQIVSLADAYDELVSEGIHKKAYPKEKAYSMILAGECGAFNPKLLECFRKTKNECEAIIPDVINNDASNKA